MITKYGISEDGNFSIELLKLKCYNLNVCVKAYRNGIIFPGARIGGTYYACQRKTYDRTVETDGLYPA